MSTATGRRLRRSNAERTAAMRRLVIQTAVDILHERGFAALSNSLIVTRADISSGALMHHFPRRSDLLAAVIETAYADLSAYRAAQLEKLEPGLPQYRAIIDLAWRTAQMREGIAVNEIRIGARSDPEIAAAAKSALTFIANDYGRVLGRLARRAGLEPTPQLQGLSGAVAMTVRSLSIDRFTYSNAALAENVLLALRALREDLIAEQLGEHFRQDPSISGLPGDGRQPRRARVRAVAGEGAGR